LSSTPAGALLFHQPVESWSGRRREAHHLIPRGLALLDAHLARAHPERRGDRRLDRAVRRSALRRRRDADDEAAGAHAIKTVFSGAWDDADRNPQSIHHRLTPAAAAASGGGSSRSGSKRTR